jgi:hypothetical protein
VKIAAGRLRSIEMASFATPGRPSVVLAQGPQGGRRLPIRGAKVLDCLGWAAGVDDSGLGIAFVRKTRCGQYFCGLHTRGTWRWLRERWLTRATRSKAKSHLSKEISMDIVSKLRRPRDDAIKLSESRSQCFRHVALLWIALPAQFKMGFEKNPGN